MKSDAEEPSNHRPTLVNVGRRKLVSFARRLTHWEAPPYHGARHLETFHEPKSPPKSGRSPLRLIWPDSVK